jgi:hypothetical protein
VNICVVAPVNDDKILERDLMRSPAIAAGLPLLVMRGYKSAASAYNAALDQTSADIVVFVHQDVYLPAGWEDQVRQQISEVGRLDPKWAVLGLFGAKEDGVHVGRLWCGAAERELGSRLPFPCPVVSIDEVLIILRRGAGFRFDDMLPGFHLYGTDISQTALSRKWGVYVIDAPVVHNTKKPGSLRGAYLKAFRYMARKWRRKLPIPTVVVPLTRWGSAMYIRELKVLKNKILKPEKAVPSGSSVDSVEVARRLGYEKP